MTPADAELDFAAAHADEVATIDRAFASELLRTETLRTWLMVAFFASIPVALGGYYVFLPESFLRIFHSTDFLWWSLLIGVAGIGYEISVAWLVLRRIRPGRPIPVYLRWLNTVEEASIPTAIMVLMLWVVDPLAPLVAPVAEIYYFFIALTALRLDYRHCLLAGAVAAAEYTVVAAIALQHVPNPEAVRPAALMEMPFYIDRACLMFLTGVATAIVTYRYRAVLERALGSLFERNRIVGLFGQHVSPEVVNKLLEQRQVGDLSEVRDVCVMFLDIRDFTTFSESRPPEEVVGFLNTLFAFMIDRINEHGGIINKFLGDGFMAIFGAPLSDGRDCQNAVDAATAIVAEVERRMATGELPAVRVGIGLHAGPAVTGHVGSTVRKEYTIIGDVVNTAARIEALNKTFGSQILVSDEVWQRLDAERTHVARHADVPVKGRGRHVDVVQLA